MKRAKLISFGLRERPDFEELWELRFAELVEFQKKYGHTRELGGRRRKGTGNWGASDKKEQNPDFNSSQTHQLTRRRTSGIFSA